MEKIRKTLGAWIYAFILYDSHLNLEEKMTYCILHNISDGDSRCAPTNAWLAEELGRGQRIVNRYIKNLESRGYIKAVMEKTELGYYRVIYVLVD